MSPRPQRVHLKRSSERVDDKVAEEEAMQQHIDHAEPDRFPTDPAGLPDATRTEVLELGHGDTLQLRVAPVAKRLGDTTVRMLGYNGSIPGPTLKVRQGSEIIVQVKNQGDLDTTVHWHGLRLENKYDGVPHQTQAPIPVGGSFTYRVQFPDAGPYWYHPHIREDYTQELGLYGNIVVVPTDPGYWPLADRELVVVLDDILLEDGKIAPFSPTETTYAAMGRFGNLTSGDPSLRLQARVGEVVRLWLTNTASTRVFNLMLPGARMKLVGGDSGRVEHEELVSEVLLAPSERAVVDVLFDQPGERHLEHHTPDRTYWLAAPPDKVLALVAQMDDPAAMPPDAGPVTYACPMHPEVTSDTPGRCPKCGMKLLATSAATMAQGHDHATMNHGAMDHGAHDHHDMGHDHGGHGDGDPAQGAAAGIEWEDNMVEVNRLTTTATMHWRFLDRTSGTDSPPSTGSSPSGTGSRSGW
jgi:FtsP/CotA-like multicopper oxidase with cupredoxin domain